MSVKPMAERLFHDAVKVASLIADAAQSPRCTPADQQPCGGYFG
jgi:hypothetical protein